MCDSVQPNRVHVTSTIGQVKVASPLDLPDGQEHQNSKVEL